MQYVEKAAETALGVAITAGTATLPPYIGPLVGFAADALKGLLQDAKDVLRKLIFGNNDVYIPGTLVLHEDQPRTHEITITNIDGGGDKGVYTGTFELQVVAPAT